MRAYSVALVAALAAGTAEAKGWPSPAAGPTMTADPGLIFTFADVPNPQLTPKVLDTLAKYRIKAVFFMVGQMAANMQAPPIIERILREGHIIANHSMTHADLCRLKEDARAAAEIDNGRAAIESAAGVHVTWFRAPYGVRCDRVDLMLGERGISHFHWDLDPQEWRHGSTKRTFEYVTKHTGRTGTSIVLTAGGGAASGIPVGGGCLIACDVSAVVGVEVRYVVSRSTDTLTIDRAFRADPLTGRAVYVGTTYTLTQAATISAYIKAYMGGGDNARYAVPGAIVQNGTLSINGAQDTPVAGWSFTGMGGAVTTHTLARPTMTTAGVPLIPTTSKVWIGTSAAAKVVNAELAVKNILELRMNDIGSLAPVGVKRTANGSRYDNQMKLDLLLESGTIEVYYSGNANLRGYDVLVQLGVAPGAMVAWEQMKIINFITQPSGIRRIQEHQDRW